MGLNPRRKRKLVCTFATSHGVQLPGALDAAEAVLVIAAQSGNHLLRLENLRWENGKRLFLRKEET